MLTWLAIVPCVLARVQIDQLRGQIGELSPGSPRTTELVISADGTMATTEMRRNHDGSLVELDSAVGGPTFSESFAAAEGEAASLVKDLKSEATNLEYDATQIAHAAADAVAAETHVVEKKAASRLDDIAAAFAVVGKKLQAMEEEGGFMSTMWHWLLLAVFLAFILGTCNWYYTSKRGGTGRSGGSYLSRRPSAASRGSDAANPNRGAARGSVAAQQLQEQLIQGAAS